MDRIAIYGPGLIGGSIALALRRHAPTTHLTIWGRNADTLTEITRLGLADSVHTDAGAAAADADLLILCTPVGVMPELAAAIAPLLKSNAVITDAGSVKSIVVEKLTPLFGSRFVGGHPMAGSERSGLSAARADLFQGAPCILTPDQKTLPEAQQIVTDFWTSLGAQVSMMSPPDHDRLVARISHLPHALAFALVNLITESLPKDASLLAGGSFRDGTRVAASDPGLWNGIFSENRVEVAMALREMSALLNSFAENLEKQKSEAILDFLTRARDHRVNLPLPPPEEIS